MAEIEQNQTGTAIDGSSKEDLIKVLTALFKSFFEALATLGLSEPFLTMWVNENDETKATSPFKTTIVAGVWAARLLNKGHVTSIYQVDALKEYVKQMLKHPHTYSQNYTFGSILAMLSELQEIVGEQITQDNKSAFSQPLQQPKH
jgi:hypothetical protein